MKEHELTTPYYIVYESKLRHNLAIIDSIRRGSGAEIIMAFKANAMWRTLPIMREYGFGFTASSLNELKLGNEFLQVKGHSYCPVYADDTIRQYIDLSSHVTFNSLSQLSKYGAMTAEAGVSVGLRVNPQCSVIETDIYNPALPGSRFGVDATQIASVTLPEFIEGLHFHSLCESDAADLAKVLDAFEDQFGYLLKPLKWVNFGGGHLMTRQGYNTDLLIDTIHNFQLRHPHLQIILEPGSAFTWRTGDLVTTVLDVVENQGINTAIIDASFACHMPDCLEMPYTPIITEAYPKTDATKPTYRLGGNSCLSGDFAGPWSFPEPLKAGQRLRLEDMNHYTTVKTNMFNGIQHPDIALCDINGECQVLRHFDYDDYKHRMC